MPSWPCSRTSCATPWRRSRTRWRCSDRRERRARTSPGRPRSSHGRSGTWPGSWTTCSTCRGSPWARSSSARRGSRWRRSPPTPSTWYAPLLDAKGHELVVALPPEPIELEVDPARMEQVLCNLLNNAAKYTEPGGRIELSAARDGDEVVLVVRDNGVGIAPEVLPRIFDLFVQADRSLDRAQGGLGIGLTLVHLHGGSIGARI